MNKFGEKCGFVGFLIKSNFRGLETLFRYAPQQGKNGIPPALCTFFPLLLPVSFFVFVQN
ncbi:hypothetical protein [Calothrix rhizosoleniae]|uniref:hypothetical protein n=1 Tax=Calothrix rhizosoleniae TaxID=888997 RepID=UPI0030DD41D2